MKVKMLEDARLSIARVFAGEVVDLPDGIAQAMIADGRAVAVEVAAPVVAAVAPEAPAKPAAKKPAAKKPGPSAKKIGKGPSENK